MKRLLLALLGLVGLLGSGVGEVRAQGAPGSWAQVYSVPTTKTSNAFQVPQVKLPDAAVTRRINRLLLRRFRDEIEGEVDSMASPRQQLQQAVRLCCFDEDTKSWRAGGDGLTDTDYGVLLNQDYLLSFEFINSYRGLLEPYGEHLTFDLRTGRLLTVSDLVADPPDQLGRRLQAAVSRRLRDNLANAAAVYGDDSARIARMAEVYEIVTWDTTPQRGQAFDTADGAEASLYNFALTPDALLLFHPIGMRRFDFEFLPDDTYIFPWARLQPRPILSTLVQAATGKKPTKRR